jgi:outer membrane receptor for monomeric catechols
LLTLIELKKNAVIVLVVGFALAVASVSQAIAAPDTANQAASTVNAADQIPPANELAPVTIRGHYDNGVGTSDAASQGVVNGEILEDIPLLRPGEALETVPGLVVTQHSGDGKANQYFLRGYNLDHGTDFASSIDGVPANMPTNAHGQGYCDVNFMIPELVDHINYRKGPYFAENGDFSSAGSAGIEYRNKLDHNIADLTIGSYDYKRALFAGSTRLFSSAQQSDGASTLIPSGPILLGAVELQRTNGPWAVPEDLHKTNVLLRLSDGTKASGWSIDGIYYDASWNATDQVPLALIQSGQLCLYCGLSSTDGGNTGRDILSGEWHNADEAGYTKISAYLEHYTLQLWSDFTFFEFRPSTGDQFYQFENRDIVGGQAVKAWNLNWLGHESTTEIGLQVRHDNINVGLLNTVDRIPFATVTNDQVSETEAGLYLQNTDTWNPWLRTLIGLREDNVFMDMTANANSVNSGSASGNRVSPKGSVILGPWEKTEIFINAGEGFHSNDARGVIDKIDPTSGTAASPVPVLVSSTGKEIGIRTEAIPGLQTSLAWWSLDSDSELVYNADSTLGSSSPNGASKRTGIEWNNHWAPNDWFLFDADLAWTHARYAQMNDNGATGNLIPNAVPKVALFRESVNNLGPWSAGLETRYIGAYPLTQDGSLYNPDAIVTNLRVQRKLTPDVSLSLDVLNLFNREYMDIAYAQDYNPTPNPATFVATGATVHPGEPREFRATLKIKF